MPKLVSKFVCLGPTLDTVETALAAITKPGSAKHQAITALTSPPVGTSGSNLRSAEQGGCFEMFNPATSF